MIFYLRNNISNHVTTFYLRNDTIISKHVTYLYTCSVTWPRRSLSCVKWYFEWTSVWGSYPGQSRSRQHQHQLILMSGTKSLCEATENQRWRFCKMEETFDDKVTKFRMQIIFKKCCEVVEATKQYITSTSKLFRKAFCDISASTTN